MPSTGFKWKFDQGYTELLNTASVTLKLKSGPSATELEVHPASLFKRKKKINLDFSLARSVLGTAGTGFTWVLTPACQIRLTLIPEGDAFLGNFRVPEGCYAVQWKLAPTISAGVVPALPATVTAVAGSRMTHTWVEIFPLETTLLRAVPAAWNNCVNPFDPEKSVSLKPSQVLRWNWTGTFSLTAGFSWSLKRGWTVGAGNSLIHCALPFRTGFEFANEAILNTGGHFYLQLSRRNDLLKFSLIREGSREAEAGASVGIQFRHSPNLRSESKLLDPLLGPPERILKDCLSRKFRIALNAEAVRFNRRKMMLKAEWHSPLLPEAQNEYARLLSGCIPSPREDFRAEGRFDDLSGNSFSVMINILDRITGFEKERESYDSIVVDPEGNLLIEKGISKTDTCYRWDEIEFIRLAFSRREGPNERSFRWNWETSGNLSRRKLIDLLKAILHGGIMPQFTVPGHLRFPLTLEIAAVTRFSGQGIEHIRKTRPGRQWEALIRALALVYPERYHAGSHWRDWIDSPEVRQEIVRNPVHCHLSSGYPRRGRTDLQRRQVVYDYRRALRFLATMNLWQEGGDPLKLLRKNLDFPLFLYFHLLCPSSLKNSVLTVTGDWEMEWREPEPAEAES